MTGRSIVRRTYDGLALFALLNMTAVAAFIAYAAGTGRLDYAVVTRVAAALRNEPLPGSSPMSETLREKPASACAGSVETPVELEMLRREADRVKAEVDQQMTLVRTLMIKTAAEREALKQQQQPAPAENVANARTRREDGLRKQIEIYEQLAPKVALEHLLGLEDSDQAARILAEMETRKAKKIVEAARSADQSSRIQAILQRVQEVAPERSANASNPEP